jgi:hypothetical protein
MRLAVYLEIALTPSALKSGAKSASTYESVAQTDPGEIFAQIHRVLQNILGQPHVASKIRHVTVASHGITNFSSEFLKLWLTLAFVPSI